MLYELYSLCSLLHYVEYHKNWEDTEYANKGKQGVANGDTF